MLLRCECGTRRISDKFTVENGEFMAFVMSTQRCISCGGRVKVATVRGVRNPAVVCNEKCESSVGHKCECSCGGKNHGGAHSVAA